MNLEPVVFELDALGVLRLRQWMDIPWLVHGFTTRRTGDFRELRSPEGVVSALGAEGMTLRTARQVHSDKLILFSANPGPQPEVPRPEADGLLSRQPGYLLAVRTADCLPILFVDRAKRGVAAVHAGWRGTLKAIARRAVERMTAEFASQVSDIEVAIGPSIGPCCFEVGSEVASLFAEAFVHGNDPPHVDLIDGTRSQLSEAGVDPARISVANACTRCIEQDYFSHRRSGEESGRMLAFVGVRT